MVYDPTAYYAHLQSVLRRSSASSYNQLMDDIRNDIVRIEPFFATARRVVDLVGPVRIVGRGRRLVTPVSVTPA